MKNWMQASSVLLFASLWLVPFPKIGPSPQTEPVAVYLPIVLTQELPLRISPVRRYKPNKQVFGSYWIGEVYNLSDSQILSVALEARLVDPTGNLETIPVGTDLPVIMPGQSSPFKIWVHDEEEESVEVREFFPVPSPSYGTAATISKRLTCLGAGYGYARIQGVIRNDHPQALHSLQLQIWETEAYGFYPILKYLEKDRLLPGEEAVFYNYEDVFDPCLQPPVPEGIEEKIHVVVQGILGP